MASVFYFANMLNVFLILCLIALIGALAILFIGFLNKVEPISDEDPETNRLKWKKRNRNAIIIAVISGFLCLTVPDGKTYLVMKGANAVGDECIETLFELVDQKLMDVVQETELVDYE